MRRCAESTVVLCLLLAFCAGCTQEMWNGSRLKPLEPSAFFADGRSSRSLIPDTVARGSLANAPLRRTTTPAGATTNALPFPLTRTILDRGQERFETYCSECHGQSGYGDGIVVKRGYPPPPSYHTDRLRGAPLGHFYDVITGGYGVMYPYDDRVKPADRWAIAAYIRALQLSQNATLKDVPADGRAALDREAAPAPPRTPAEQEQPPTAGLPLERLPGDRLNGGVR